LTRELEFVIDTTGQLDDLGIRSTSSIRADEQRYLRKRIEAALLIGPPSDVSGISFKCYTKSTKAATS